MKGLFASLNIASFGFQMREVDVCSRNKSGGPPSEFWEVHGCLDLILIRPCLISYFIMIMFDQIIPKILYTQS